MTTAHTRSSLFSLLVSVCDVSVSSASSCWTFLGGGGRGGGGSQGEEEEEEEEEDENLVTVWHSRMKYSYQLTD